MPPGSIHIMFNVTIFFTFIYFFGTWSWIIYLPVLTFYSLLPDLDAPISPAAVFMRRFSLIGFLLGLISYYIVPNFWVGIFSLVCLFMLIATVYSSHRRFFHGIIAGLLLSLPLLWFGWGWFLVALWGYFGHLLLDGELFSGGLTG